MNLIPEDNGLEVQGGERGQETFSRGHISWAICADANRHPPSSLNTCIHRLWTKNCTHTNTCAWIQTLWTAAWQRIQKIQITPFFNWMQSSAVSQRRNYFAKRWYSLIKFYIFVITADLLQQKIFSSWILWINTSSGQAPFLTTKIFYVTFCHKLKFMFYQIWYKTSLEVPL